MPSMHTPPLRVLLLGATGTIGSATERALVRQGHSVVCLLRHPPARGNAQAATTHLYGDPCDPDTWRPDACLSQGFDAIVSCMASRTGSPQDAWQVDYQAHLYALAGAKAAGITQFVLLSAICVQKPLLAFQQAKLAFETALIDSGMDYSIVRPTAFFKSLSGQLERVKRGKPFLVFGDGELTACKPISDDDLGDFLAGCLTDTNRRNRVLPIGGPGPAITPLAQGKQLFQLLGQPPRFKHVPVRLLDVIIRILTWTGKVIPAAARKAELAKIGRYYATESMLVWDAVAQRYDADATPSHGDQTLFGAYADWANGAPAPARGDHAVF